MKSSIRGSAIKRAGLSLVELMIGVVILSLLLGTMAVVVSSGQGAYAQDLVNSHVDALARRTVDHLVGELIVADRSSVVLTPGAPFGASAVSYQRGQGWGGGLVISPTSSLQLVLMPNEIDDGIDNDGNGLIDECRIIFTPDVVGAPGLSVSRVNYVRELLEGELPNGLDDNGNGVADEGGLFMTFDAATGIFTAQLTLERVGSDGRLVTRTLDSAVRVRND